MKNITDKNIINISIEKSSSSNYSSKESNTNYIDSYNIDSSSFLNNIEKSDDVIINEYKVKYKVEDVDFSQENNSLTLFYDNFYQD